MTTKTSTTLLGALCALLCQSPALAGGESDFVFFLSADAFERQSVSRAMIQKDDFTVTADILFSFENGPWRALGEFVATNDERDLERIQIGYDFAAESTVWLGRFHQPISAWNHRYHHGVYLQPSISKPAIENWEDLGGVLPSHVSGLLVESLQLLGDKNGIRYSAAYGFAPEFANGQLQPFDALDPDDGSQLPIGSVGISYFPDFATDSSFGLGASYARISADPIPALGINIPFEIRQLVLAAKANWDSDKWQLISALYYVDNSVNQSVAAADGWFLSGYVQASHDLSENTDAYLRLEKTSRAESANYLQLFPYFVSQRELLGFRYDFAARQAVAIEISSNTISMEKYSEFRLQWSAAFP